MSVREAFFDVCSNAEPARAIYVSLYVRCPYYGGPEEGGWWGEDRKIVAYQQFPTKEQAEAAMEKVIQLAKELTAESARGYGDKCLAEMKWCEDRGIDDTNSVFGEVDGHDEYYVALEDTVGSHESVGCRHYE